VVVPSTWSIVPTPNTAGTTNTLQGVSCVSPSFCVAVGYADPGGVSLWRALVEQWNGSAWSIVPSPDTSPQNSFLYSVSCASTGMCVAVGNTYNGSHEQTLVEQWNGSAWSIVPSPDTSTTQSNDLDGVSCVSSSFCVAVGYAYNGTALLTLVEQWNGSAWSIVPSPDTSTTHENLLYSVSCVSSSFCVADGEAYNGSHDQTLVEQWNGSAWSIVPSPDTSTPQNNDLFSVSCASNAMCVAVGTTYNGTIDMNIVEQWNGAVWTTVTVPDANATFGDALRTVNCFGPTSCVAGGWVNTDNTGSVFQSQALTWNGSTWALATVPNPPSATPQDEILGLSCVPGAMCVGVGMGVTGSGNFQTLALSSPVTRSGYDEVASDGGIFTFGGAHFYGSTGSLTLNKPIVGMAVTSDGGGYWLDASDGGIFAFGDAGFFGSTGSIVLNKPIVGMAATPDGGGYWLVASDGGIFAFGNASFFGSQGATALNKPVVGMAATPDGKGYWLVASDGGIFTHGDAQFYGSQGATALNKPIVGMAATSDGHGYWLVASDGGIFTHGDAVFAGSEGGTVLNKPVVGMGA
jgi:hypothetical protein